VERGIGKDQRRAVGARRPAQAGCLYDTPFQRDGDCGAPSVPRMMRGCAYVVDCAGGRDCG